MLRFEEYVLQMLDVDQGVRSGARHSGACRLLGVIGQESVFCSVALAGESVTAASYPV